MKAAEPQPGDWREIITRTVRGYYRFVPAIIITWVIVEVVAVQVPRAPWRAQAECSTRDAFYDRLAEELTDPSERDAFLESVH